MSSKEKIQKILSNADVKLNGDRNWDIKVHNEKIYSRVLAGGTLALGESYMDGWWDCKSIDQLIDRVLRTGIRSKIERVPSALIAIKSKLFNMQNVSRSKIVGKKHYDIGNELYKLMLDKRMNYSCAYWKNAKTLDKAQENKLDLICKKINIKKGQKILDIGCGWGSFAKYAAQKYKAELVGITISKEQAKFAKENCKNLPIEIRLQDYRKLNEKFDHIISIGMFEHVGVKNYRNYMKIIHKNLKDNGLFLLHTIGKNKSSISGDPWFDKYIFPNSFLPSPKQIAKASEGLFVLEDWHSFGSDYDKTLMAWHDNFKKNWNKIKSKYDERFYRMWVFYLLLSAGSFRARQNQLWQIVFSKKGVNGVYKSVR